MGTPRLAMLATAAGMFISFGPPLSTKIRPIITRDQDDEIGRLRADQGSRRYSGVFHDKAPNILH